MFSYILNLNSLFFVSDFPKSGWDAWASFAHFRDLTQLSLKDQGTFDLEPV